MDGGLKGVQHRVAGNIDVFGDALPGQIVPIQGSGGKVEGRQPPGKHPVHLLREGGVSVVGAQSRLYVAHRNLLIEGRQRYCEGGGGIAVYQHRVRPDLPEHRLHAVENPGGDAGEGLPRSHYVEIVIRFYPKDREHLIQHLPMLSGDADPAFKPAVLLELLHQRAHLDRLRPSAEHAQYPNGLFH